jgi:hypothetical protein
MLDSAAAMRGSRSLKRSNNPALNPASTLARSSAARTTSTSGTCARIRLARAACVRAEGRGENRRGRLHGDFRRLALQPCHQRLVGLEERLEVSAPGEDHEHVAREAECA